MYKAEGLNTKTTKGKKCTGLEYLDSTLSTTVTKEHLQFLLTGGVRVTTRVSCQHGKFQVSMGIIIKCPTQTPGTLISLTIIEHGMEKPMLNTLFFPPESTVHDSDYCDSS